ADYLRSVRAVVRERLNQGDDKDAAVDAVGYDEFVGDRLPKDRNGQPRRHRATVEKIADEELRDMRGNASARREEVSNEK
ncbi:MAG: hypothetical protein O3A46_12785, partial [Candidatus Poribacteria bacterium]|nr:hypothetical protein [Candidatus Poribacteria bacterium]